MVTGSDHAEQTFERAERDLGEGPCIDAFASGEVIATQELWTDPRWPRLGPAAHTNQIRGVLSAPVFQDGRAIGTCNAYTTSPRTWSDNDVEAIRAYADMLSQLIGSVVTPGSRASWPPSSSSAWSRGSSSSRPRAC